MKNTETMKQKHNFMSWEYDMNDGWYSQIMFKTIQADDYTLHAYAEAWIGKEDQGTMLFMFGYDLDESHMSLPDFENLVETNFEHYKDLFLEEENILDQYWRFHS